MIVNSTFQMVLFESTNIIEIYIEKISACPNCNNGNSVIGIQNATRTEGVTPVGVSLITGLQKMKLGE